MSRLRTELVGRTIESCWVGAPRTTLGLNRVAPLTTRRIEYVACTSHPGGRWFTQQPCNLAMQSDNEQRFRFLSHDHDTKFSGAFDEVFRAEGVTVIRPPGQAPNANVVAERWVRT